MPSVAGVVNATVMHRLWQCSSVSPDRWTEDDKMALLQIALSLLFLGQAIYGVGENVKKHLLSMEDFSFSLNEAKPKHFGLEMFAVVLVGSWNLPCLLPCSFPVGLLPTGTAFSMKHPHDLESKSCNASGSLDLLGLFVIFVLKFFCMEKKESQCFLQSLR